MEKCFEVGDIVIHNIHGVGIINGVSEEKYRITFFKNKLTSEFSKGNFNVRRISSCSTLKNIVTALSKKDDGQQKIDFNVLADMAKSNDTDKMVDAFRYLYTQKIGQQSQRIILLRRILSLGIIGDFAAALHINYSTIADKIIKCTGKGQNDQIVLSLMEVINKCENNLILRREFESLEEKTQYYSNLFS